MEILRAADRVNGMVFAELEEGAELGLADPTAEGKTFLGWVDENGEAITATTMPAADLIIYASWSIDRYTVTVKQDGKEDVIYTFGVEGVPATETTAEIIGRDSIKQVIEEAYADNAEVDYTISNMPETWELQNYEITVTAVPVEYKLTKILNKADRENSREELSVAYGAELGLTAPTAEGKTFLGWVDENGETITATTMPAADLVIYANWELQKHTITIKQDGVEDQIITFAIESDIDVVALADLEFELSHVLPVDTAEVDYTITGMPEEWALQDYVLTITTAPATHKLTKILNKADRENSREELSVAYGAELDLTAPTAEGKTFLGWVDENGEAITATTMPAADLIIYANWSINQYTVTVKDTEGTVLNTYTFGVEESADPAIIGIDSLTWYIEQEYLADYMGIPDAWELQDCEITLTARQSYKLTKIIDKADRENNRVEETVKEGIALDLTAPTALTGKTFVNWVDENGETITATTMPAADLIIYANWSINQYKVTVKELGKQDVVLIFGIEASETPAIIDIDSISSVVDELIAENYTDTDYLTYTVEGKPETWELQDYEITVIGKATEDINEKINTIFANASKVTDGKVVTTTEYDSDTLNITMATFELAENYAHIQEGDAHKWFMGYGDNKVLWLQDLYGYGASKSYYEPSIEMLNGYAFETPFDYTNSYYGVENFIKAIYGLSENRSEYAAEGVYGFSVDYTNENGMLHKVSVTFAMDDDGVLTTANIEIVKYSLDYAMEYQLLNATTYTITQGTTAEVTVAYDPEVLLMKSYTLQNADGEDVSEFTMNAGDSVTLNFANVADGVNIAFETFTVTVTDGEGIEVEDSWNAPFTASVSSWGTIALNISAYAADTYTVTIESGFVTKTLTVTVETPAPTEIKAMQGYSTLTSANIYDDAVLSFKVQAQNEYADASATVEITSQPEGANATLEVVEGNYTFKPDGVGTYVITITSDIDDTLTSEVTITVSKAPSVEELIDDDTYQYVTYYDDLKVHFVADGEDTYVIAWYEGLDWDWNTVKTMAAYVAVYDAETKTLVLTAVEDMQAKATELGHDLSAYTADEYVLNSVQVKADYSLYATFNNSNMGTLEVYKAEEDTGVDISGEYKYVITDSETGYPSERYVLSLFNDGTATLNAGVWNSAILDWVYNSEKGEATFNYVYNAETGNFLIDNVTGSFEDFGMFTTIVVDTNANTVTVTLNDKTLVFEK